MRLHVAALTRRVSMAVLSLIKDRDTKVGSLGRWAKRTETRKEREAGRVSLQGADLSFSPPRLTSLWEFCLRGHVLAGVITPKAVIADPISVNYTEVSGIINYVYDYRTRS